jgi:hypothetical protein
MSVVVRGVLRTDADLVAELSEFGVATLSPCGDGYFGELLGHQQARHGHLRHARRAGDQGRALCRRPGR